MQWQLVWKNNANLTQLSTIIKKTQEHLQQNNFFCLWLEGHLGAGKTTFTRELFYSLGLNKNTAVNSPSFTYLLEYEINQRWYAHLDFYRMSKIDLAENESLFGLRTYDGLIVEWPQHSNSPDNINPTHRLTIETNHNSTTHRLYSLYTRT